MDALAGVDEIRVRYVVRCQEVGEREVVVTSDEGVLSWGRTFGIKEMPASVFQKRLEGLLS